MNRILYWLSTIILVGSLWACSGSKKITKIDTKPGEFENSLLWEVNRKDLNQPSYIFGTVHIIGKEKFFWPDGTLQALDKSQEIVFEVDMAEMTDMGNQLELLTKAYMKDDITLRDLITDDEYEEVEVFFKKLGLPLFFFERMKPMFLSVMTSMDGDLSDMQNKMTSYEFELMDLAKTQKMESSGLETLEFQMSLFDSIPYEAQADMLIESIRSSSESSKSFDLMVEMYTTQNINGMLTTIDEEDIGEFESILLTKRNKAWIPQIEKKIRKQATFFAVGAGHLAGENGVLWLLKMKGYEINPLSISHGTD